MSFKLVLFYVAASVVDSTFNLLNAYSEDPFEFYFLQKSFSGIQHWRKIRDDLNFLKNSNELRGTYGFIDYPGFTDHQGSINNPSELNENLWPVNNQVLNGNTNIAREINYFENERRFTNGFPSNENVRHQGNPSPCSLESPKTEKNFKEPTSSQQQSFKNMNHQSGATWSNIVSPSAPVVASGAQNTRLQNIPQSHPAQITDEQRTSDKNYIHGQLDVQTGDFIPSSRNNLEPVKHNVEYSRNQVFHNTRGYNGPKISGNSYANELLKSVPQTAVVQSENSLPRIYSRQQFSVNQASGLNSSGSSGTNKVNTTLERNFETRLMDLGTDTVLYFTRIKFTTRSPKKLQANKRVKRTLLGSANGTDYQQLLKLLLGGLGQGSSGLSENTNKGQHGIVNNGQSGDGYKPQNGNGMHLFGTGNMSPFGHLLGGQQGIGLPSQVAQYIGSLQGIGPNSLLSFGVNPLYGLFGQILGGHRIKLHRIITPRNSTNARGLLG